MNMTAPAHRRLFWIASITFILVGVPLASYGLNTHQSAAALTRPTQPGQQAQQAQENQGQDGPLKKPQAKRKHGADDFAKRFLDDVKLIITPEEEQAFKRLGTDAEKEQFIEIFWQHRDPTPDTEENEYRDEHYRRLAYADERYSAGVRGRNTDRGRIYILHGPPDSIESHPAGGPYQRTAEEGGGETQVHPFERWRYRHLENIGEEVEIEFVDTCGCGDYHISLDPDEKDAESHVPNAGLKLAEELGITTKAQRLAGHDASLFGGNSQSKMFDKMDQLARAMAPPPVKFRDLEEIVNSKIRYDLLPFDVQIDYVKASADTVLVPITIQVANRDLTYVAKDGIQHASVNIFGRVTTLTGRIAQTFEEPLRLDQPQGSFENFIGNASVYQKMLPLRPGLYLLSVVLKDVNGDKLGSVRQKISVPEFSDDKLASSSLIVADVMEMAPATEISAGNFVIGTDKVRPRVASSGKPAKFKRNQKVNLWMQVYNLAVDQQTRKPSATVVYEVRDVATNKPVIYLTETADQLVNRGDHVTLHQSLAPNKLGPGVYEVTIKVNDLVSKQTIAPTAKFSVE